MNDKYRQFIWRIDNQFGQKIIFLKNFSYENIAITKRKTYLSMNTQRWCLPLTWKVENKY